MPRLRAAIPVFLVAAVARIAPAQLCDASTVAPDLCLLPPAAVGEQFVDPAFGRPIVRLTDAIARGTEFVQAEYATQDHFNADGSWIMVEAAHGAIWVLDLRGSLVRDLAAEPGLPTVASSSYAVWDPLLRDVLYYTSGNELRRRAIGSPSTDVAVATFGEYAAVARTGETDIAPVDPREPGVRSFVLVGQRGDAGVDVFVVRGPAAMPGAAKRSVLSVPGGAVLDWAQITVDHVVLGFASYPSLGGPPSVRAYDHDMVFQRELAHFNGHQDVGIDAAGRQVLYLATSASPDELGGCVNSVLKLDLADGGATCLGTGAPALDWTIGIHLAAPSQASPWVYVSTYGSSPDAPWLPYTNEIVRFRADGGCPVERLAQHHSRKVLGNDYNYQARASVNRDGSKVLFNSNFGLRDIGATGGCFDSGPSVPLLYSDTYLLLLDGGPPHEDGGAFTSVASVVDTDGASRTFRGIATIQAAPSGREVTSEPPRSDPITRPSVSPSEDDADARSRGREKPCSGCSDLP